MLIKKLSFAKTAPPLKTTAAVEEKRVFALPTEPIEPSQNIGDYSWLVYGDKKIGKSSLAACFPDALFFMFEPGAKALKIMRVDIDKWETALGFLSSLEKSHKRYRTAVISTGFEAYQKCLRYICAKERIEYPRDDNYGKDWDRIAKEFRDFHNRIFNLGLGMIVECHQAIKESTTFTGEKYDQMRPLLPNGADSYYRAVIDNVVWYHKRGKERFLQIQGTEYATAGVAPAANERFITTQGEQIFAIPLSENPHKGYDTILSAFNNKQTQTFKEETETLSKKEIVKSIQKKIKSGR